MQQAKDNGYKKLPNHGTLFKAEKTEDNQPNYKGYLLLDRAMIEALLKDSQGDLEIDLSLWRRESQSGATILSLQCKAKTQPAAPTLPPLTKEQQAQRYLSKLKHNLANISKYADFEELYKKIQAPSTWEVFEFIPAIAQEAIALLSAKGLELSPPKDLADVLSALDVECSRLKLPSKEHCLARWNKSRQMLTPSELCGYLEELRSAEPVAIADEFF
jgi:hypothetical protein